jgi:ZIP family zinc transporter
MEQQTVGYLLAVGAAAATMLGWVAVAAKRTWTPRAMGIALLVSAMAMLAISLLELIPPGLRDPDARTPSLGLLVLGLALVPALRAILSRLMPGLPTLQGAAVMVALFIALHNVPEGAVAIAATIVSLRAGVITAVALALHNIPEGMAVSTAVLAAGGTRRRAFALTAFSMIGEILGATAVLILGATLSPASAAALLCLVGGVMVSLSVTELIPAAMGLLRTPPEQGQPNRAGSNPTPLPTA